MFRGPSGNRIVVPMVHRRWTSPRGINASPPASRGFGGIIAEGGLTADDLTLVLGELCRHASITLSFRPNPLQAAMWADATKRTEVTWVRVPRHAHVVPLAGGADAVAARFTATARRNLRRTAVEGVDVACYGADALEEFFALMDVSRTRWAEASHEPLWLARVRARGDSLGTWKAIAHDLGGACRVYLARWRGETVAGTIVLFGPNAHYTRGAMRKDLASQCRANYALHWRAVQDAIDAGFTTYHMGESGTSTTLGRFKRQFGAEAHDYCEYRRELVPFSRIDRAMRGAVKQVVRFREAS
jgi:hypothetical protein